MSGVGENYRARLVLEPWLTIPASASGVCERCSVYEIRTCFLRHVQWSPVRASIPSCGNEAVLVLSRMLGRYGAENLLFYWCAWEMELRQARRVCSGETGAVQCG